MSGSFNADFGRKKKEVLKEVLEGQKNQVVVGEKERQTTIQPSSTANSVKYIGDPKEMGLGRVWLLSLCLLIKGKGRIRIWA